ncbi:hypothetical protein CK936_24320 [Streptomyces albireticuli]|uniref:HTH cro/C1-type domain-containing protein n=2 Tax=Streptomyces albireticuli TaxID=1940 RepID=A0A2A2D4P1_9ACTN|nr:hypothetical protein CK936_24320 [Streptomyces albireticuli]
MRRSAGLRQVDLAKMLGVSKTAVVDWENEHSPSAERLPAIAEALGVDLDVLFPRLGQPDLADLRADARLTQSKAAVALGTTRVPLSQAETGKKRLSPTLLESAASLYGVTQEELSAAQERSFGVVASSPVRTEPSPRTLSEKIHAYLEGRPKVTNDDVATAVNRATGANLVPQDVEDLRTRARTAEEVFAGLPMGPVQQGLAEALGVTPFDFMPGTQVEEELLERLDYLTRRREGIAIGARGGTRSISPEMVATITDLLLRKSGKQAPQAPQ